MAKQFGPPDPTDWYAIEVGKVLSVFARAVGDGQGIVSFLQPPMDEARAKEVVIPVVGYFGFLDFFR